MRYHDLKIEERYFKRLVSGEKTCEIRNNDRDFQVGDLISFKYLWQFEDRPAEADFDGDYFKDPIKYKITHVLHFPDGLKDGYVALSIKLTK